MRWPSRIDFVSRYIPSVVGFIKAHVPGVILLGIALLSTGYTLRLVGSYFRLFNINIETLLDGEVSKTLSSRALQYQLIRRINKTLPEDAVIMVFRVADFSFYGKRKYVSYLDEKIAGHAKYKAADDVWRYLRQKGISHIYLPPYSLPSYYNSGLEGLLASPAHSRLLYDFKGFRLFEIRKNIEPVSLTMLIGEDFSQDPGAKSNWIHKPKPENAGQADKKPSGIVITGAGGLLSRPDEKAIAYRGRMKFEYSPLMNKLPYHLQDNGIYRFQAALEGRAFLKIFLQRYSGGNKGRQKDVIPLWEGVLNGNKRNVRSTFAVLAKQEFTDPMLENNQAYRLVFELGSGKSVEVHNWSMKQVHYNKPQPFQIERQQRSLLAEKGWHLEMNSKNRNSLLYGLKTGQEKPTIFVFSQNSRRLTLESPAYYNPENMQDMALPNRGNAPPKKTVNQFDRAIKQSVAFSFFAKGEGVLELVARIACLDASGQGRRDVKEVPLRRVALSSDPKKIRVTFYSPCAFKYVRLLMVIKPDRFSDNHSGIKPVAIELQDLVMAKKYIGVDQKIYTQNLKEIALPVEYYKK